MQRRTDERRLAAGHVNQLVDSEVASSEADLVAPTSLRARWRGALQVRVAWLLLAGVVLGLFAAGLSAYVQRLANLCQAQPCDPHDLTPEKVQMLAAAGLTPYAYAAWFALVAIASAAVFASAAALLIWRRPHERMAQFAAFALLLFGGVTFPGFGRFIAEAQPGLSPTHALLDVFGRAAFTALVFIFPSGRFVPGWTRLVALGWIAVQLPAPFLAYLPGPLRTIVEVLTDPAFVIGLATAAFAQVYRYRHVSTAAQRQQTRWIAIGFATALSAYLSVGLVALEVPGMSEPLPTAAVTMLANFAVAVIPVSITVALLRDRLFDVDALIGRALVDAARAASAVAIDMLVAG